MSTCAGPDPLSAARQLRDAGRADAALACYDRALSLSSDASLYFELAALAHSSGRVAVLEQSLRASVRLMPAFGDGHFELGNAMHSQNRFAEAAGSFEEALRQPHLGDRGMVLNNLANALTELGDESGAERAYSRGVRLVPRGSTAAFLLNGLANQQSARGRDEEAVATIERALRVQPAAHYAAFNLGNFLRRLKRYPEAGHTYRRALAAEPSDARYQQGLAAALHSAGAEGDNPGALSEAVEVYGAALRRTPSDHRLLLDLGGALSQLTRHREALHAYAEALPLQLAHARSQLADDARSQLGDDARSQLGDDADGTLGGGGGGSGSGGGGSGGGSSRSGGGGGGGARTRRVVFYCRLRAHAGAESAAEDSWGPSSLGRGVGGSEEAVIFVSRELARRGWAVEVYANPPAADLAAPDAGGVVWRPWHALRPDDDPEVLIAWRNLEAGLLLPRAARAYVWLQDIVDAPGAWRHAGLLSRLGTGGVLVLSAFHRRGLPRAARHLALLTSNGLDAAHLVQGDNPPHRFMYAAWPTAGLQPLLERWGRLRRRIHDAQKAAAAGAAGAAAGGVAPASLPEPRLAIYYGFPRWLEQMHGAEAWYPPWREHMEQLLRQPGVEYYGMVNHTTVAAAYASSGFYLFPSDKPETSGVNLMKAQARRHTPRPHPHLHPASTSPPPRLPSSHHPRAALRPQPATPCDVTSGTLPPDVPHPIPCARPC